MYIEKLTKIVGFIGDKGQKTTFNEGDYKLLIDRAERDEIPRDSKSGRILAELLGKAKFSRYERNNKQIVAYYHAEVDGWTATLAAAAQHNDKMKDAQLNQFIAIEQLVTLHYVVRTEKIDLGGEPAYKFINLLWQLTPTARKSRSNHFPEPTDDDLATIRLVKFVDAEFKNQVSLHFHLPHGKMVGKMYGTDRLNIKHLGHVLAGGANIHPHIVDIVKDVAIEQIDPAVLFDLPLA